MKPSMQVRGSIVKVIIDEHDSREVVAIALDSTKILFGIAIPKGDPSPGYMPGDLVTVTVADATPADADLEHWLS
jgi:hypothetical protein